MPANVVLHPASPPQNDRGWRLALAGENEDLERLGEAMPIVGIEHVQLAMPPGEEDAARDFYTGALGIPEAPKPPNLARRGGVWFENSRVTLHLGVERDFRPARKAHPALLVWDLASLVEVLRSRGVDVADGEPLEGYHRVDVFDPFGNRIELMEPEARDMGAAPGPR